MELVMIAQSMKKLMEVVRPAFLISVRSYSVWKLMEIVKIVPNIKENKVMEKFVDLMIALIEKSYWRMEHVKLVETIPEQLRI